MRPASSSSDALHFRRAEQSDLNSLLQIEDQCFTSDRLSKRSFRHWINAPHGILIVAEHCYNDSSKKLVGYGLVWCHRGTRLARLYSLAVLDSMRGQRVAQRLLNQLEKAAADRQRLFMRLEVETHNNAAITLYERCGYRVFGEYSDYYEDGGSALRMQKQIFQRASEPTLRPTPWYPQSTEFTCGPAALMMAMGSINPTLPLNQGLEMDIWREATTIFMTSGLGGCHPVGLALSARRRNFSADVYLNTRATLFVDGVRAPLKKQVLSLVHEQFIQRAGEQGVDVHYEEINQLQIEAWLKQGCAVIILISTYRLDGKKAPHWVTITSMDERCLYVHDPSPIEGSQNQLAIDCQHLPICCEDFGRMSAFGSGRLRTAVAIRPT